MPLATTGDIAARLGRTFGNDELTRAQAFIDDARGLVCDYCRTDFQQHTDETYDLVVEGSGATSPSLAPNLVFSSITLHDEYEDWVLTTDEGKVLGATLYLRHAPRTPPSRSRRRGPGPLCRPQ